MSITKEQATPGTKVKIPTRKSVGASLGYALREEDTSAGYFVIHPDLNNMGVIITAGSSSSPESAGYYLPADLDLYEDHELANPTAYPLPDPVNPAHYQGKTVFNQMLDQFGRDDVAAFCRLNAFKYLSRAGKKAGSPAQDDLKKCQWYLTELLALGGE